MKKIDIHAHTTNRMLKATMKPYATLDVLRKEMRKWDVEKTVLLATYFPHRGSGVSNYRLLSWMNDDKRFMMFGSLDFEHYFYQGYNELNELAARDMMKGIKVYTCYQEIDLKGDKLKKVLQVAREYKLPLMFHTGYSYSAMRTLGRHSISKMISAKTLERVAKENSDLTFIFSHMSKPFFKDMEKVAKENENVYTDMSGLIASRHDRDEIPQGVSAVRSFVENVGSNKLLFGTDFPVQTHEDSVYFVEEGMKGFKEKEKQEVYYNNARRILRI
jgi:predicted TIM-barrel fold metal-dependent hydrolase